MACCNNEEDTIIVGNGLLYRHDVSMLCKGLQNFSEIPVNGSALYDLQVASSLNKYKAHSPADQLSP